MTRQSNADYQRAYRQRQASLRTQLNTRTEALERIAKLLEANKTASAAMARVIALDALKRDEP